jgi:hypothetical protein
MTTEPKAVITPFGDSFFDADWRYQLAIQLAADPRMKYPAPDALRDDLVRAGARFLRKEAAKVPSSDPVRARFDRIRRWGLEGAHRRIGNVAEALLLTEAPLEAIAADMGCSIDDLRMYEGMFFNVRGADGAMGLSPAQKAYLASEGTFKPTTARPEFLMWRRVGACAGYSALVQLLELGKGSWADAPTVDLVEVTVNMTKAETLAKLAAGAMSTGELFRLEANRIKDKLVRHETGELKQKDEAMELLLQLMQMMAPKMVEHDRIRRAQAMEAAHSLQGAQDSINQTEIADLGVEATNEAIDQQLRPIKDQFAKMNRASMDLANRNGMPAGTA